MCRMTGTIRRKIYFEFKLQTEVSSSKQNLNIIFMFLIMLLHTEERK